eukprot:6102162-Pyramimonas_sp.AAC.1
MGQNFPRGAIMTWQGYGRCVQAPANAAQVAENVEKKSRRGGEVQFAEEGSEFMCMQKAWDYLDTGKLPKKRLPVP